MNFLIFGAGAVGGYVGGKLALAGHGVTFLARPSVAQAINSRGLRIVERGAELRVPGARAAIMPGDVPVERLYDCIVLAVKSYDTANAIEEIRELGLGNLGFRPAILCLQNGADNESLLAEAFGAERVIAGTVTTTVTMDEPGTVVVERERGVGIAVERPFGRDVAGALAAAGIATQAFAEADAMKWSKLLVNLPGNATSAICDIGTREIFDHPSLYTLEVAALRECLAVMRAKGIAVVNLPGTPSGWLALGLRYLPASWLRRPIRNSLVTARGGKMPSFHVDLSRGKGRSEVGWLNGAVVRHGEKAGVATPANRLLTETLEAIVAGRVKWEEWKGKPERLTGWQSDRVTQCGAV
ncbi:MAG: 2-dehydropantoate 2-reductase [Chloroflexi bacterium]|nr:2-dehydropantoate 2-reductase [Chloroflexota bacterium]